VPEGWKAQWNGERSMQLRASRRNGSLTPISTDQYKEWFYVNLHTKKSQWDKPTEPARPAIEDDGPPAYSPSPSQPATSEKKASNYSGQGGPNMTEDERLARQLQDEEDARNRNRGPGGASSDYYNSGAGPSQSPVYGQNQQYDQQLPPRDGKRGGLFSKLMGKTSGSSQPQYGAPQQQYYQQGPPPGQYGYPQQGYPPQGGYYGGPPQQQYYQQQQRPKKGLGTGGAAALGVGGGLVGGLLLADAFDHVEDHAYDQGYDQGVSEID